MSMLTLLAACALQGQAPIVPLPRPGKDGRGRDPWVFRAIFEDRTRMLILAPAPNWWMAFNPETGAMHKVWKGKMDFRGKVWDFSQDNSRAEGSIFLASPSELWRLPDTTALPNWSIQGVTAEKDGWLFPNTSASIASPPIDASGWHRVFLAFDETGRKGRFHASISDAQGQGVPQWFESAVSVEGENSWQWNFKRIERPSSRMVVKITSNVPGKKLRGLRLYGDRPSWFDSKGQALDVVWDGYELIKQTTGVVIRYRLKLDDKTIVPIEHIPDLTRLGWREQIKIGKLPKGQKLILHREGLSTAVQATGNHLPSADGSWTFDKGDHIYNLDFKLPEAAR